MKNKIVILILLSITSFLMNAADQGLASPLASQSSLLSDKSVEKIVNALKPTGSFGQRFGTNVADGISTGFGQSLGKPVAEILVVKFTDLCPSLKSEIQKHGEDLDQKLKKAQTEMQELNLKEGKKKALVTDVVDGQTLLHQYVAAQKDVTAIRDSFWKYYSCANNPDSKKCKEIQENYDSDYNDFASLIKERQRLGFIAGRVHNQNTEQYLIGACYQLGENINGEKLPLGKDGKPSVDRYGNPARYTKKGNRLVDEEGYPITEDGKQCPVDHEGKLFVDEKGNPIKKEDEKKAEPVRRENISPERSFNETNSKDYNPKSA